MSLYQRKDTEGNLISPYWYCEFNDGGKVVRKSTEVKIASRTPKALEKSQAAARQQEALIKQQYFKEKEEAAENAGTKADITFEQFSKKFLEWVEVKHAKKPKTIRYYKERVTALLRFDSLKHTLVSRIDDELIAAFVQWRSKTTVMVAKRGKKNGKTVTVDTFRPVKVATLNRDLTVLKRVLNIAKEWKYRTQEPRIRNLSGEEAHERVINHEEEQVYLAAAPALLQDFATIALDTGLRPDSELCALRWEHVHFEPVGNARLGYVHIPRGKTKNSKRNVPLSARVREVLTRRHEAVGMPQFGFVFARDDKDKSAVPYCSIDTQHDRTLEKLDFRFRIYDCRHTFGTRLGESGADAYTICKLMGHSNILVSQRYVHPTPERLETAFAGLDAYNQERAKAAKEKAEKEATGEAKTLAQTA
jgi:integrase